MYPQIDHIESLSVVIPVFNEKESLTTLYEKLIDTLSEKTSGLELIFVDDGSQDGSSEILKQLAEKDNRITVVCFGRNRGKAAALSEGFRIARGKYVVTIDADLQDDPEAIPGLIKTLEDKGVDIVSGWKQNRQDRFIKRNTSKLFNLTVRLLTGIPLHDINNGLKAYRREVVKHLSVYGEMHRLIPVLASEHGYTSTEMKVRHFPRKYGTTKYGASRFLKGFLDVITVLFLTRFMKRPMHFFGSLGIISAFAGLAFEVYILILKYAYNEPFSKHLAGLLLGVLLLILGAQFFSLGLLGELITFRRETRPEQPPTVIHHDNTP